MRASAAALLKMESKFMFDSANVLRQCGLIGNVEHVIGLAEKFRKRAMKAVLILEYGYES